jgi:hypothetical protein
MVIVLDLRIRMILNFMGRITGEIIGHAWPLLFEKEHAYKVRSYVIDDRWFKESGLEVV